MKTKFTIHDLAADLSVSPGTVSKVLNGKGNVTEETRVRIINRAKQLGYVANHSARILKAKHSWTIGVVFSDIALFGLEHPFFGSIIQAFKNFIEEHGYEMVFIPKKLGNNEQTYLEWARNKNVDGVLILTGDLNDPEMIELTQSDIPCVSTDIVMNGLTTVISDDAQGIELVYQHFLNIGRKRIYAMSGSTLSRAYQQRTIAYEACLKQHTIQQTPDHYISSDGYGYQTYYDVATSWIKQWKEKPEAIIAFSDDIAMALIRALEHQGYHVPHDISVSGYDDIQFASLFTPSITTVKQNKQAIAETAAKFLLHVIQDQKVHPTVHKIPVRLVIRQSTDSI
jgi:LacI family transcriptional regulator